MKKYIFLWITALFVVLAACHDPKIGYLITKNASYDPDTLYVRKTPDPIADSTRIKYHAPWISLELQGYEGTEQIYFSVESVKSSLGEEAAANFRKELSIRGGGRLMYPLKNNALPGSYVVSVRLTNDGYSQVVEDAFTFIVVE